MDYCFTTNINTLSSLTHVITVYTWQDKNIPEKKDKYTCAVISSSVCSVDHLTPIHDIVITFLLHCKYIIIICFSEVLHT